MHMISKKDLSKAEMDTLTKSCSPTTVITANGEVQTHEEAIVYVKELDMFLTMNVLKNTPAVLSLGKLCDENGYSYEWINGQKPHLIKNGIRIICNTENFVPIVVPGLSSSSSGSSSTSRTPMRQESHSSSSSSSSPSSPTVGDLSVREREDVTNSDISPVPVSEFVDDSSGRPDETQANKNPKTNKKETTREWSDPLCSDDSEIPEWLQEFRENLVDDEIPLQGGSHASSSHEASLEPTTKRREDLGKHNVHAHFPKDRNCEICKRTKITRAPCRTRNGEAVPRAENVGDLITADHKVLSDNCDLEDSKSTSGGTLCVFGSHTFVPISWMCKKQTAVSHSSTESAIISLDTGLRLDGLPALELWDLIVSVLGNVSRVSDRSGQPDNDVCGFIVSV